MSARRIGVVTGGRADYGLLLPVLRPIESAPALELRLIVTGGHLSPSHGETRRAILADGFESAAEVACLAAGDDPLSLCRAVGEGVAGFAQAFQRLAPDIVLLLGDRYEILAAAEAAMLYGLAIGHICGGDVTEGAFDDSIRHAISKMAHLHFVSNEMAARRLRQLGEDPARIRVTGNPGLDLIRRTEPLDRAALEARIAMTLKSRNLLVTYHPETRAEGATLDDLEQLLAALDGLGDGVGLILTQPNADPGHAAFRRRLEEFAQRPNAALHAALGQQGYIGAMHHVDAMVGNSSSGLMEMPSFAKPTINVGGRQDGRPRATSVIDVAPRAEAIGDAIQRAFAMDCRGAVNPFGDGMAAARIVRALQDIEKPRALLRKTFHDLREHAA